MISIKRYVPTKAFEPRQPSLASKSTLASKSKHLTFNNRTLGRDSAGQDESRQSLSSQLKQFSSTTNLNLSISPSTSCSLSSKKSLKSLISLNSVISDDCSHRLAINLFSQEQSMTILNRICFLKIRRIFEMMDDQNSGFVSEGNFSACLEPNLVKFLKPVLDEIDSKRLKLCLQEFESKVNLLLARIPYNERMELLGL